MQQQQQQQQQPQESTSCLVGLPAERRRRRATAAGWPVLKAVRWGSEKGGMSGRGGKSGRAGKSGMGGKCGMGENPTGPSQCWSGVPGAWRYLEPGDTSELRGLLGELLAWGSGVLLACASGPGWGCDLALGGACRTPTGTCGMAGTAGISGIWGRSSLLGRSGMRGRSSRLGWSGMGGRSRQILSSGPLRQNRQLGHGGWGDGGVVLQGVRGLGREGWEVGSAGVLLPGSFQQLLRPAQHSTPVMLDEVDMGPCLLRCLMLQGLGGLGEGGLGKVCTLHVCCKGSSVITTQSAC